MSSGLHAWTDEDGVTHVTIEQGGAVYTLSGRAEVDVDLRTDLADMEPVRNWRYVVPCAPSFALTLKLTSRTMNRESTCSTTQGN